MYARDPLHARHVGRTPAADVLVEGSGLDARLGWRLEMSQARPAKRRKGEDETEDDEAALDSASRQALRLRILVGF